MEIKAENRASTYPQLRIPASAQESRTQETAPEAKCQLWRLDIKDTS
jgi:hypothetical protein